MHRGYSITKKRSHIYHYKSPQTTLRALYQQYTLPVVVVVFYIIRVCHSLILYITATCALTTRAASKLASAAASSAPTRTSAALTSSSHTRRVTSAEEQCKLTHLIANFEHWVFTL
jgi:hypothetical protein